MKPEKLTKVGRPEVNEKFKTETAKSVGRNQSQESPSVNEKTKFFEKFKKFSDRPEKSETPTRYDCEIKASGTTKKK